MVELERPRPPCEEAPESTPGGVELPPLPQLRTAAQATDAVDDVAPTVGGSPNGVPRAEFPQVTVGDPANVASPLPARVLSHPSAPAGLPGARGNPDPDVVHNESGVQCTPDTDELEASRWTRARNPLGHSGLPGPEAQCPGRGEHFVPANPPDTPPVLRASRDPGDPDNPPGACGPETHTFPGLDNQPPPAQPRDKLSRLAVGPILALASPPLKAGEALPGLVEEGLNKQSDAPHSPKTMAKDPRGKIRSGRSSPNREPTPQPLTDPGPGSHTGSASEHLQSPQHSAQGEQGSTFLNPRDHEEIEPDEASWNEELAERRTKYANRVKRKKLKSKLQLGIRSSSRAAHNTPPAR